MIRVEEALKQSAEVYEARQKQYGDSYKTVGNIMATLFPDYKTATVKDHTRLHLVGWMVGKLCRYAESVRRGESSDDSLKDLSVYAMMLYCEEKNHED